MRKQILAISLIAIFVATTAIVVVGAERPGLRKGGTPNTVLGTPVSTMLNINKVASWYSANGEQERIPSTGNSGLYYPRGTSTAIYSAGLVWGGNYNDGRTPQLRVNGQSYNNGTKPGAILGLRTGVAEDAAAPDVRIYRIRRDYASADLRQDAAEINQVGLNNVSDAQIAAIRAQYLKDWAEWPWQKGAPFYDNGYIGPNGRDTLGRNNKVLDWGEDANKNGLLEASEDANTNGKLDGETPGLADADQVIWYVCNDIGVSQPWVCPESGMEEQATIWGYNRTDAIGNVIFKRFRLIYKGTAATPANARIDSMYMCQWSDPDLGDSGDDFSGCDTVLSMAYVYNARPTDANYLQYASSVKAPPASGYDFLQGPIVRGIAGQDRNKNRVDDAQDFAIFDLKLVGPGYINLPMTSSLYFAAGGRYSDPPFTYNGAVQWYQMLRGLPPTPQGPPDPAPLVNPSTGQPTPFWLSGDPVLGSGWLDGVLDNPGDRRILLSTGPFTMALGDTQELVSAWVGGLGPTNIKSIRVMKYNDKSVQLAYDNLFNLPKPPINPKVVATALDRTILLDWGSDSASVADTEVPVYRGGFAFEGYKLYQMQSASATDLTTAILLASYDVKNGVGTIIQETLDERSGEVLDLPVQFGSDNGISRRFVITEDKIRGGPLVNGQRYYFAVTAYNNAPLGTVLKTLESSPQIVTVIPELPRPGTRYPYDIGDTLASRDEVGQNDAVVRPIIYNPALAKGDTYRLQFDSTTNSATFKWTLTNSTKGTVVYSNKTDLADTVTFPVFDAGFELRVALPPVGMRSVRDQNGADVFGAVSTDNTYRILSASGTIDTLGGRGRTGRDFEIRFDGTGSFALSTLAIQRRAIKVPFSVWDLGRTSSDVPRKVIAVIPDSGSTVTSWALTPNSITQGGRTYRIFEPIWISAISYPTTGNDSAGVAALAATLSQVTASATNVNNAVQRIMIANLRGDAVPPVQGTSIRFNKYHEIRHGDVKSLNVGRVTRNDVALARKDISAIKAFPNPYYGLNRAETSRDTRFITFSHLPDRAVLRIFNLAGILVRQLDKNDASTQFLNWDLQNSTGLPVASGIYVVYVEMPDLNVTKTIKVAIIQEQQFLRNY